MRWARGTRVFDKHNGRHEKADQFRLGVSDGASISSALVNLSIALLADDAPYVSPAGTVRLHALNGTQTAVAFGVHNLLVLDEDSKDEELSLTLDAAPAFGLLKLVRVARVMASLLSAICFRVPQSKHVVQLERSLWRQFALHI